MRAFGSTREEVLVALFRSVYSLSPSINKMKLIIVCTNYYWVPSEGAGVDRSAKFNLNVVTTFGNETLSRTCRILQVLSLYARCTEIT